jgi:2-oxoglutarate dehydrogenase E1 component
MRRDFRKPLIAVTSKKLLRFKDSYSKLAEIAEGTRFNRVIAE